MMLLALLSFVNKGDSSADGWAVKLETLYRHFMATKKMNLVGLKFTQQLFRVTHSSDAVIA